MDGDRPSSGRVVHRFIAIEQRVLAEQPDTADLERLFEEWGLTGSTQECFWVIALDNVAQVKTVVEVARGGFHDVLVHIPSVLAAVLAASAERFYVAHNHPSGEVSPTEQDMVLTGSIMAAANAAGLHFEDHIVVGPEGRFSFYEDGLITRADTFGIVGTDFSGPAQLQPSRGRRGNRRAAAKRRNALLYLPGNPSHWFASTGRGIRYTSLCGVDRRNKQYRPKRGARHAQCPLCQGAGGVPVPGSMARRETASRSKTVRGRIEASQIGGSG